MNCFLDTNIWIRYFIGDDLKKQESVRELLEHIEQGFIRPYTSSIVLLEVQWVLMSLYKSQKHQVQEAVDIILSTREMVVIDKTNFRSAFLLHKKIGLKLADCLIATQIGKGITLCTYDKEFQKIPGLLITDPSKAIKNIP